MENELSDSRSSASEVELKPKKTSSSKKSKTSTGKKDRHSSEHKDKDKDRDRGSDSKKTKRIVVKEVSSEEDAEPEVFVDTVKVSTKRKKVKPENVRLQQKATVVDDGGDDGWTDQTRAQQRQQRIGERKPTGHPQLAKLLAAQSFGEEFLANDALSDEETEVSPPKRPSRSDKGKERDRDRVRSEKKEKSSKRDKERSRERDRDEDKPVKKSKKPKEVIKFADAKNVDSGSEGSWEEEGRKEERFNRIRSRVPTGHPGLAKRLLESKMLAQLEEDEDPSAGEEVIVRTKTTSKSSRHKSSKSSTKARV